MDSSETADELTIVNRSKEYRISKKLIGKVPYFEKMLSHDLKESKVELHFDEQAFEAFLDWVKRGCTIILIEMNYVIDLHELADYFGLDSISKECLEYFEDKFTIEHLPIVIPKVSKTSKFINSGALNAFICRYFSKIAHSYTTSSDKSKKTFWLDYPIEIIEYICALDLMIYSEVQVFDAIMRWVNFKIDSRKCHLERLLKLVRWCHLEDEDLSKIKETELLKSSGLEPIFCLPRNVNCDCTFNRTKQRYFVMIEKLQFGCDWPSLRIKVLDNNLTQLFSDVFYYGTVSFDLLHDEGISEIRINSKQDKTIKIDWARRKYAWTSLGRSYDDLRKKVFRNVEHGELYCDYPEIKIENGYLLLEATETYNLLYFEKKCLTYISRPIPKDFERFSILSSVKVTVLDNNIYLLSKEPVLYEFKIQDNRLRKTWSYGIHRLRDNEFSFEDSLLTESPARDKIILINNFTKDYICFDVNTKVSSTGRMISYSSVDGQKESKELSAFTTAFLPLNAVKTSTKSNSQVRELVD